MTEKPKRPWKNLEEARLTVGLWHGTDITDFPCLVCRGRGGYRDMKDLCPIEGYKGAPLYTCKECGGSGFGSKQDFVAYYKEKIAEYKKELVLYRHRIARSKKLKEWLSEEDLEIIRECL